MCYEVYIGEKMYESVRNLEAALKYGIILDPDYQWLKPPQDSCLCALDLAETAARNGYHSREIGSMAVEFIETRSGPKT